MFKRLFSVCIVIALAFSFASCNGTTIEIGSGNRVQGSGKLATETRPVSGFDRVQITTSGEAKIVMGDSESVVIEAEDNILPLIETNVTGGKLVIAIKSNTSISASRGFKFTINASKLSGIELNGSANAGADALKTDSFTVASTGSGNFKINSLETGTLSATLNGSGNLSLGKLQATGLNLTCTGSGQTDLSGQADNQTINLHGSGSFQGGGLKGQTVSVTTTGSGTATVWATANLTARTSGSGDVKYYGQPAVASNATGSGRVNSLGNK